MKFLFCVHYVSEILKAVEVVVAYTVGQPVSDPELGDLADAGVLVGVDSLSPVVNHFVVYKWTSAQTGLKPKSKL